MHLAAADVGAVAGPSVPPMRRAATGAVAALRVAPARRSRKESESLQVAEVVDALVHFASP